MDLAGNGGLCPSTLPAARPALQHDPATVRRRSAAAFHAVRQPLHSAAVLDASAAGPADRAPERSPLAALSWAVYLGMSWTWCIGMFLPVLLVRQYGLGGFWAFAVPNVVGAAAMGFILRRGDSEALVERHRPACTAFSAVTIAFHVFFVTWMVRWLLGEWATAGFAGAAAAFFILGRLLPAGDRPMACAALALSLASAGMVVWATRLGPAIAPPNAALDDLGPLGAVCLFGFLLCPYLDLTFHKARQATSDGAARFAFAAGFGLFFLAMILFSLVYALVPLVHTRPVEVRSATFRAARLAIGVHILVQSAFTVAIHLREMLASPGRRARTPWLVLLAALCIAGAAAGVWSAHAGTAGGTLLGLDRGDLVYRLFMGFYGLVFPAYVLLCLAGGRGPTPRNVAIFAVVTLAALPFFFRAFILGAMPWLLAGLALVLLARPVTRPATRPATASGL